MTDLLQQIAKLAENAPDIAVVWLYGSCAKGNAHASSDYDLAIAFNRFIKDDPIEKRLRPEWLALDWKQALGLLETMFGSTLVEQGNPACCRPSNPLP